MRGDRAQLQEFDGLDGGLMDQGICIGHQITGALLRVIS
jgi:hypothetical protein